MPLSTTHHLGSARGMYILWHLLLFLMGRVGGEGVQAESALRHHPCPLISQGRGEIVISLLGQQPDRELATSE